MAESSAEGNSSGNSRWWESYLVRYLSGFLVGTVCVSAFVVQVVFITGGVGELWKIISGLRSKDSPLTAVLVAAGLLGLLYSYLVSAPITVIHYGRGVRIFWDGQSSDFKVAQDATSLSPLHDTHLFQARCGKVPVLTKLE